MGTGPGFCAREASRGLEGNSLIIVYCYALRFIISEHPHRSAGAVQLRSHAFSGGTLRGWATYRRLDALR